MKTSTFVKGLIVALVAMIAGGFGLAALNGRQSRPEGVAENWLTAVGDTTRKGVEADARKRAEKIGRVGLAKDLLHQNNDGKSAFEDIEVGKAVYENCCVVAARFRVHARVRGHAEEFTGGIFLEKSLKGPRWRIQHLIIDPSPSTYSMGALAGVPPLPSNGGPPPSSAPMSLWIGGLVGAAIIGLITTSLVRLAGRPAAAAATA